MPSTNRNLAIICCFSLILIQIGSVEPRIMKDFFGKFSGVSTGLLTGLLGTVGNATRSIVSIPGNLVSNTENLLTSAASILQGPITRNLCDAKTVIKVKSNYIHFSELNKK